MAGHQKSNAESYSLGEEQCGLSSSKDFHNLALSRERLYDNCNMLDNK